MKFIFVCVLSLSAYVAGDVRLPQEITDENYRCNYNGKEYRLGERIETPDAACFVCNCRRGFDKPSAVPPSSCAIIDCPWGYYSSKPHCETQYIDGKCCPELRCSAPPPNLDVAFMTGKRLDESTDGYEITAKVDSELTIYCIGSNSSGDLSGKEIEWKHKSGNGVETAIANSSNINIAFFPPATWALYFRTLKAENDGFYTCTVPSTPPQTQTTRIIVRTEPRPPVIDPICYKPAFSDTFNDPCPGDTEELPWYYNTTTGDCAEHIEKSCKWGKENHFTSMSHCWNHCLDDCYASPEPGTCDALISRYFYNQMKDRCETFNYGGCGGNRNNFETLLECEDKCANIKYRSASKRNV